MLFWKICVVGSVLDFEGECVIALACHYVWKRVETGIADGYTNSVVPVFLKEFDKYGFTVKASLAPTAKRDLVDFFHA